MPYMQQVVFSKKCFQNKLTLKVQGKLVCQWRQVCRNCSFLVTSDFRHECFKKFCNSCNKKPPSGHYCYVTPLKRKSQQINFCIFSVIRSGHKSLKIVTGHLSLFSIHIKQMCSKCEDVGDLSVDCKQCGKLLLMSLDDHVGKLTFSPRHLNCPSCTRYGVFFATAL